MKNWGIGRSPYRSRCGSCGAQLVGAGSQLVYFVSPVARGDCLNLAALLLPNLGGERVAVIVGLTDRPDLKLRRRLERAALHPFERLVEIADLPDPVAADELLRLGERA